MEARKKELGDKKNTIMKKMEDEKTIEGSEMTEGGIREKRKLWMTKRKKLRRNLKTKRELWRPKMRSLGQKKCYNRKDGR